MGPVDDSSPVDTAQVFAEMLTAVCHPEFFDHTELEVYAPHNHIDNRHTLYTSSTLHFNYIIVVSRKCI